MQNITKTREVLTQVRFCCLEIAHGCEQAQTNDLGSNELQILAAALFEMHELVKKLVKIDPALDHDGDTQPSNEKPEPPHGTGLDNWLENNLPPSELGK